MTSFLTYDQYQKDSAARIRAELTELCDPEYITDIPDVVPQQYMDMLPYHGSSGIPYSIIDMDTDTFLDEVALPHGLSVRLRSPIQKPIPLPIFQNLFGHLRMIT
ncbi:MAG TPA: hypothetical protein O0X69_05250 [Methanocorpusculum sp.]|nr:hypothetical protein [Methanocorpusculum sp.]HJJ49900.1 hypothetical protein [Methanocorpusculum sp.]